MTDTEKIRIIAKLGGKKYVSLSAFSKLACMAYSTAKRLSDSGQLKTIPVGGVTRVPTDEVLRFMMEGNAPQRPSDAYYEATNPNINTNPNSKGDSNG